MTEIEFHFNVPDKLQYGCRLLRKAYRTGAQVVVTGEPEILAGLDELLWSIAPAEFVPHGMVDAKGRNMAYTPILLAARLEECPHSGVLINLGQATPLDFERFKRFIEVVTDHGEDRALGRNRWKHYKDRGYALRQLDLSAARDAA